MEPPTRILGDRYELRSLVATGGMGQVWRAHDRLLGRPVAVKVLRSDYAGDPTFLARFRAEARHTALLHHPAITSVFDYGETDSVVGEHLAYLVMELVEGESLSDELRRERSLSPDRVLDVLRQTATGLAAAHKAGVVHRDVKPGNLLVRWDGSITVTDFGIAWSASSVSLTDTGQVIGTAHYLSPEQAEGRPATPASDVYALGMVGYELLAGRRAFEGESSVAVALSQIRDEPPALPAGVPDGVRELIAAMLVKHSRARLADGDAVVAAVDRLCAGSGPGTLPDPAATEVVPARRPPATVPDLPGDGAAAAEEPGRRRRRGLLAGLAATLLVAGLGSGVFLDVGGNGTAADASTPTAGTSATTDAGFVLVAADYVGRPVDEVVAELTDLGLDVVRAEVVSGDTAAGRVIGVDPAGSLVRAGESVTVTAAVAPVTGAAAVLGSAGDAPAAGGASAVPAVPAPTSDAPAREDSGDEDSEDEASGGAGPGNGGSGNGGSGNGRPGRGDD